MGPTLRLLLSLNLLSITAASLILPADLSLSSNISISTASSVTAAVASASSQSVHAINADYTNNPEPKEYTVFPLKPQKVPQVDTAIKAFAVKDSVRMITDQYAPDYHYVLYWQFKATEHAAQGLRQQIGTDVSLH